MHITVNGNSEDVDTLTISDLVCEKNIDPSSLVVEYNGQVIRSDKWGQTLLKEGDQLELLSFVGGG